jgi:hypothetical protein
MLSGHDALVGLAWLAAPLAAPSTRGRAGGSHRSESGPRATGDGRPAVRVMSEAGLGTLDGDE